MKNITPNRDGTGSTYGGTQSPDPNAPDGYQKPAKGADKGAKDTEPEPGVGKEYQDGSSYGNKSGDDAKDDTTDSPKAKDDEQEGSPVR